MFLRNADILLHDYVMSQPRPHLKSTNVSGHCDGLHSVMSLKIDHFTYTVPHYTSVKEVASHARRCVKPHLGRFSSMNTEDTRSSILVMFCWARMYIMFPLHEITSGRRNNYICLPSLLHSTRFLFCGNYEENE